MKALLLINHKGGTGKIVNKIDFICSYLKPTFEQVDYFICEEVEDFVCKCKSACGVYDALLFAGGDGTFHLVVNALSGCSNPPILGVIPSGTLCDAGKNFGASKNLKKSLKIIKNQYIKSFDVAQIDDEYFVFSASYGIYSDIPYRVTNKQKKMLGHFAYYFKAVPEVFKSSKIDMELTLDNDEVINITTPFLLVMNSSYMAGFKINKKSNISDGLIDVFYSKCEPFNGLMSYFFFKKRLCHYQVKQLKVKVNDNNAWDVDGERFDKSDVSLKVVENAFKIYCKHKNN